MLAEIYVMIFKEWKEFAHFQGGLRSGIGSVLVMVIVFGIVMPIQFGTMWVESAASLAMWAVVPPILITAIVADSFAGERERHTLETLLASRLSDQAILLGKMGAIVSYVWTITQVIFIAALIPLNILHGDGEFLIYSPEVAASGLVLSFLLSCLMSSIGVLVSLRAGSVKQAQQVLGLAMFVLVYAVPMAATYGLRYAPEQVRSTLLQPILSGQVSSLVLAGSAVLIIVNIALYVLTKARFQRARLIFAG